MSALEAWAVVRRNKDPLFSGLTIGFASLRVGERVGMLALAAFRGRS